MGRAELPSVIAEQKCLIEDLAQSNQEYILKFKRLKLGIEEPPGRPVNDASKSGVVETESSNITKSLSGTFTRKFKRMKSAIPGTSLQDKESTRGLGSEEFNTTPWWSPKAQRSITGSLATPPNADTDNINVNPSVRGNPAMPPVKEWGIPTTEAPMTFGQEALFKQLEHHSMLIKNLLKEVDEAYYKITFKSRLRMKGGIAGLHEEERRELEKMWGSTALQSAEQRLDSLMEGIVELPTSAIESPYVAENFDTPRPFKEEPVTDAMSHSASIDRSSTYARDTTHGSDLLSSMPSLHPVHQARPQSFAEFTSPDSNMPRPAIIRERPSNKLTVTRARRRRPKTNSPLKSMGRAEIAKAKAEEQRKSSTISKRKDSGDRIGGYTEPHLEEEATGEGGVEMGTPPILATSGLSLRSSAGKQNEAIWSSGTELAAPDPSAAMRDALDVRTPINHIHVRYNQLMIFHRGCPGCRPVAHGIIRFYILSLEMTYLSMARTPSTTSTKETLRNKLVRELMAKAKLGVENQLTYWNRAVNCLDLIYQSKEQPEHHLHDKHS